MLSSRPFQLATDTRYFPAKTPGRGLKNRAENAYPGMGIPMTVNGKGKNANKAPRTPFQPASAQPQRLFKDQKTVLKSTGRPLADKTPLPNRVGTILFKTPLPGNGKPSKLKYDGGDGAEVEGGTPDSAQRPSSMRKHIKHPRVSGRPALETPMNNGNHWDVSDSEIVLPDAQPIVQETLAEDGDDLDELEYGPPNTLDLPYEPPFDFALPNYKEVGKALFQLAHSTPYDDVAPPVEPEIPPSQIEEPKWDLMSLPELETDDPFHIARAQTSHSGSVQNALASLPSQPKRLPSSNATTGDTRRPQSSVTRIGASTAVSRPASRLVVSTAVVVAKKTVSTGIAKSAGPSTTSKPTDTKRTTTISKPTSSAVLSTKASATARTKPSTSTAAISTRSTPAAGRASVPAPVLSKPTAAGAPAPRRPHTALATNLNVRAPSSRTKPALSVLDSRKKAATTIASKEVDVVVIRDAGVDMNDGLDFKFDI